LLLDVDQFVFEYDFGLVRERQDLGLHFSVGNCVLGLVLVEGNEETLLSQLAHLRLLLALVLLGVSLHQQFPNLIIKLLAPLGEYHLGLLQYQPLEDGCEHTACLAEVH